MQIMLTQNSDY